MQDPRPSRKRLLDWLEVHGPQCADPRDPDTQSLAEAYDADAELRRRYRAIEQADAVVAEAFADVPLPEGLEQRVLAQLKAAGQASGSCEPTRQAEETTAVARSPRRRSLVRRHAVALAAGVVVAASVLLVWAIALRSRPVVAEQAVLEEAIALFLQEAAGQPRGTLLSRKPSPVPYSEHLRTGGRTRWRPVERFLGQPAIAFDVQAPGAGRITLYVVRCRAVGLRAQPPARPKLNTRNCSAAAWQDGTLVYVLVVAGGPEQYRRMLRASGGPIT